MKNTSKLQTTPLRQSTKNYKGVLRMKWFEKIYYTSDLESHQMSMNLKIETILNKNKYDRVIQYTQNIFIAYDTHTQKHQNQQQK